MSTRFVWLPAVLLLLALGLIMGCGSHASLSSLTTGVILVTSQGVLNTHGTPGVILAFTLDLSNGHIAQVNTFTATPGLPTDILVDPAGTFAYVAVTQVSTFAKQTSNAIGTFKINSDGTVSAIGQQGLRPITEKGGAKIPLVPVALAMDSAGKFLFVADQANALTSSPPPPAGVSGAISVFSIGSNAALAEIPGSPFAVPVAAGSTYSNPVALAVSPTILPAGSPQAAPTKEFLYVTDSVGNQVWEFQVDKSSGALGNPQGLTSPPGFTTGSTPAGVTVDPFARFVYVANQVSNDVSAYAICNGISPSCLQADGTLVQAGSNAAAGINPVTLAVDPSGGFLFVVDQGSGQLSTYRINQASGAITALSPRDVAVGVQPTSVAIRSDDSWIFVTNQGSSSLSGFHLIPATGTLGPLNPITTSAAPFGVAVK